MILENTRQVKLIRQDKLAVDGASGVQVLSFDDSSAVALTVPENATGAIIVFEADATTVPQNKAARFYEGGQTPSATDGYPLGHLDIYEIQEQSNLIRFRIIGIEAGKTHTLQVLYYK